MRRQIASSNGLRWGGVGLRMARPLLLLALACILTGCVASAARVGPAAPPPSPEAGAGDAYAHACPPGPAAFELEGVCVSRLARLDESLQEPYLAAHPTRPGVYALGVNAAPTARAVATDAPGADAVLLDVYVTEDGGASWRHAPIPRVPTTYRPLGQALPAELRSVGDPALAFDERGVLHVSGLANPVAPYGTLYQIFAARSADLGRTWSGPVIVSGAWSNNDRNWVSTAADGKVYVSWQRPSTSHVAWSLDGGLTWREQPRDAERKGCISMSPALPTPHGVLLACAEGGFFVPMTGLRVLRFDDATGRFAPLGSIAGDHLYPRLLARPGGDLVMTWSATSGATAGYATSADGGMTWSAPRDLRALLSAEDAWNEGRAYWSELDARGHLHVLLKGWEGPDRLEESRLLHAVLDPTTDAVLHEALLPAARPDAEPPATVGLAVGDDFHGIAFQGGEGLLAWTRDRTILLTRVVDGSAAPSPGA